MYGLTGDVKINLWGCALYKVRSRTNLGWLKDLLHGLTGSAGASCQEGRVCAVEQTSCCSKDTVGKGAALFFKKKWGEAGCLNPEGVHAALCVDGLVHSLEADCWCRIFSICKKTLFGSPECFGLLPQQRKYRLSVLIHCPLRVFYCWKALLCHTWRNEEWLELKIVVILSVCRNSQLHC